MNSKEKYDRVFTDSFEVSANDLGEKLEYNSIETWDSIGHMQMIAELEDIFEIEFEMDDIINFSSYNKGIEILVKYGIGTKTLFVINTANKYSIYVIEFGRITTIKD